MQGQHDKRAKQHQLVGERIEEGADLGFAVEQAGDGAVERVGYRGRGKHIESVGVTILAEKREQERNRPQAA